MAFDREFVNSGIIVINSLILLYLFFVQSTYFTFLLFAVKSLRNYLRSVLVREFMTLEQAEFVPPITVIVPAYNEEMTIVESVNGFMLVEYPQYEILVVNDGSKDNTLQVLIDAFQLIPIDQVYARKLATKDVRQIYHSLKYPKLVVVDKENGGKADAINTGINVSRYPLFCVVDADSLLEEKALLQVVYPFVENPEEVVAVGGIVRIANGCRIEKGRVIDVNLPRNSWARMQVLEYLRSFLIGRVAWSEMNSLLIIAGAFGLFKKSAVIEVGGYLTDTVGEDMELTVRLHRHRYEQQKNWRVLFVPDPVCWTQAPEDKETLEKQRNRWHRGLAESLWRHKKMLFNPRYGVVGMFGMPYFILVEWLGPLVEITGLILVPIAYAIGMLDPWFAAAFFGVTLIYSQIVSVGALLLEEYNFRRYQKLREILVLFGYSLLENFYFRPLNSWWKTRAIFQIRKQKHMWGEMRRQAFTTDEKKVSNDK